MEMDNLQVLKEQMLAIIEEVKLANNGEVNHELIKDLGEVFRVISQQIK